ncbi:MAG: DivIVA domain-containing protein [Clostridia bacterium]|nr:DivIVA domain-containing protein [Clostridia bacterium]
MLTTDQILNAMFTPVSKGAYNADEVDSFLKNVAESYETALQNNKELIKKISILADKIESYRNDEEAIKLALLDARRLAETISREADEKAKEKLEDADLKAKVVLDGANRQSTEMINEAREKAKEIVDNARVAVTSLTDRAQRETEQAIVSAQQKATEIVLKAEAQGRDIVGSSKADFEYYSCELERIKAETAEFKAAVEKLCKGQLELIAVAGSAASEEDEAVAYDDVVSVEAEAVVAQAVVAAEENKTDDNSVAADAVDKEEAAAADEELHAEDLEEVFFDVPDYDDEADETDGDEDDSDETDSDEDNASDNDEDEDIFSIIEDLNFDDIVSPDSIAATLDEAVAEAEKAKNASVADEADEVAVDDDGAEDIVGDEEDEADDEDDDEDDDDDFSGFKVDLDEITSDDGDEDDEITSLFDSFFSDED